MTWLNFTGEFCLIRTSGNCKIQNARLMGRCSLGHNTKRFYFSLNMMHISTNHMKTIHIRRNHIDITIKDFPLGRKHVQNVISFRLFIGCNKTSFFKRRIIISSVPNRLFFKGRKQSVSTGRTWNYTFTQLKSLEVFKKIKHKHVVWSMSALCFICKPAQKSQLWLNITGKRLRADFHSFWSSGKHPF